MSSPVNEQWSDADTWWDEYVQSQLRDLETIGELIDAVSSQWAGNASVFTQDPLEESWRSGQQMVGPLRTNQEENWSQWLAHLIRSSDGAFMQDLFGSPEQPASAVRREVHVSSREHHDRRVDIFVEGPDRCVSIEVKIGDENYEKTPEAAYLAETNLTACSTWNHYLLVPESKGPQLADAFNSDLKTFADARPTIVSEEFVDVAVLYWNDVAHALRDAITDETAEHWEASAFSFITLIEQKIADFHSQHSVKRRTDGSTIIDIPNSDGLDLDDQITYLTDLTDGGENAD